ncbi:antiviral RADAR system adenosine triphosphatase RdrA [Pseudoalteromonas sp. MMG012]|uniref:antiviral RADAR system adenosine triphosphatase RdrA n=1 Tax=Pseudoalteromonas sp. MMG012 TaxID=2822686 RepID=UPI001B3A2B94|nr:antiviral RADAR system adenosine triphosphatase RdrA [Pseudoalteromonas sp. MMG012]MBQ4849888.1 hypothetical protein [Pseudoalteromonas sp. MMG012]
MATKYLLDLIKEEYRDDFISLDTHEDQEYKEFWQFEARDKLLEKLQNFVLDAQAYKSSRVKNKTWLSHNAILVNGTRGTGKTVFLRNCQAMWRVHCQQNTNFATSSIYFLPAIDPTMLIDQDNFANVIIAQIYSDVESCLTGETSHSPIREIDEATKSGFYKALQKLADSLGKKEEFDGCTGIDKILQYKSGISVEKHFHSYVESALHILGCNALALPIDDVDMALGRAYEVVDEVRRLLGCPYIIPIVSGDYSLYEQMVGIHFDEKAYRKDTQDGLQVEKGKELAGDLTKAYLTKVFPSQMRITLLPIHYIYPTLRFKAAPDSSAPDKSMRDKQSQYYEYRDYVKSIYAEFYPLCLNEEVLHHWPKPEFAREFTQLARAIPPNELVLAKTDKSLSYKLWKNYINWAEQKQEGLAYTNANSYLTFKNGSENDLFNILDLPSFNPKKQIKQDHIQWADKRFLRSQMHALGIESNQEAAELKGDKGVDGWKKDNVALLKAAFTYTDRALMSMPPLEFYHPKSMVSKQLQISTTADVVATLQPTKGVDGSVAKKEQEQTRVASCSLDGLLVTLYTQEDAYSTLVNNYRFVCLSRAFEVLVYSFLMPDSGLKVADNVRGILNRRPFYSIFNMSPTKALEDERIEDKDEFTLVRNMDDSGAIGKDAICDVLEVEILNWRNKHQALFEGISGEKLIPIFAYMFNKTFTAFHSFRFNNFIKGSSYENEYLTDHIKRFEYMLVNAARTAMIESTAVHASVAITPRQQTIRDPKEFRKYDRTLGRNTALLEAQEADEDSVKRLFINSLKDHPLFTLIRADEMNDSVIPRRVKLGEIQKEKLSELVVKPRINDPRNVEYEASKKRLERLRGESITSKQPPSVIAGIADYIVDNSLHDLAQCWPNLTVIRKHIKYTPALDKLYANITGRSFFGFNTLEKINGDFINNVLVVIKDVVEKHRS